MNYPSETQLDDAKAGRLPSWMSAKFAEVSDQSLKGLEIMDRFGLKIGFGTDLLGHLHPHQTREFLIRREVQSAAAILRSATAMNAEILMEPNLGEIRPGGCADILIVDEAGFKTQWLDRKLTVNGAAYTGNVANYQYSYIDFATASPVTGNIERVRISGGELESRYSPIAGLSVFLNIGVSVPKITSYSVFPQYVGNQTPRANDCTVQTGIDYVHPTTASWSFFAGVNVQYLSKVYWYIDNLDVQDSKTYTNARFGLKDERWTATIWGRNIFDTRAYDTYDPNQATGLGRDVGYPNEPAQYGVEVLYRF